MRLCICDVAMYVAILAFKRLYNESGKLVPTSKYVVHVVQIMNELVDMEDVPSGVALFGSSRNTAAAQRILGVVVVVDDPLVEVPMFPLVQPLVQLQRQELQVMNLIEGLPNGQETHAVYQTTITWRQTNVSDQLRQEVQLLQRMIEQTQSGSTDRSQVMEDFMKFVTERLSQFSQLVEQVLLRQMDHIQQCVDNWVTRFSHGQERKLMA